MSFLLKLYQYLLVAAVLTTAGCQLQGKETSNPDKKDISRRDLYRAARSQGKILIVEAWQNAAYEDSLSRLVQDLNHPDWQVFLVDHKDVSEKDLASIPSMLIGSPNQNSWISRLMSQFPFAVNENQITIGGKQFDSQSHSIVLNYYPNPLNVKMPLGIFTSGDEALVWQLLQSRISSLVRGDWSYEIIQGRKRVLLGNLSQRPEERWEIDHDQQILLPGKIDNQWESGPFVYRSYDQSLNETSMKQLEVTCQVELRAIQQLLAPYSVEGPIFYYLYPSTEMKGLMTGNTDQSHFDQHRMEVHTAFDDHFLWRYSGKENQLILKTFAEEPSFDALEVGLSVYLNRSWQQKGYKYWASHLINGDNGLRIDKLLDHENFYSSSPLIREALSASMVEFLLNHWGKAEFLKKYRSWRPTLAELELLNQTWWAEVKNDSQLINKKATVKLPYLQGFNFTHEGYQIYNGYGSLLSDRSLDKVCALGANTVAIVPYSWMRNPAEPSSFRFSNRPGSENDEGIIHAISRAKKKGLFTILKPHVWISGSWPGEVEMKSETDWDRFFYYYYRWISHYALLAEIYQVDVFCIGVELSRTTLKQEERWRNLISRIRKIYHGKLTYAANWGEEFEGIEFWDDLDYIGLNSYYPLSHMDSPKLADLQHGFTEVLKKVHNVKARYEKPVILTEIGFRSIESPWIQPHEAAEASLHNEGHQAICYKAVFQAIEEMPVIDGILWWKWPTNLEPPADRADRRFVPAGKQAEVVIQQGFGQKKIN